ncbi:MAG TPA: hypothetical protein VM557_09285 [Thermoanaerobaculia bacterium]|nr:hypothetical protein [Thermoanaerobaculia bacterium]
MRLLFIFALVIASCSVANPPPQRNAPAGLTENPFLAAEPEIILDEHDVVLLAWEIEDDRILRESGPFALRHLDAWRAAIAEVVGSTEPDFLMRRNRELYPWLESEHPGQEEINRRVERGELGRLRSMNGLESFLLDFHAARYPLFEEPSELGVLVLSRATRDGTRLRVYYVTDGRGLPPREGARIVLERAEADVRAGWDARVFLHNHTFDLESERGMLAIAAPSESDLQFIRALATRLGIDEAWIIDGFNSFELDADRPIRSRRDAGTSPIR